MPARRLLIEALARESGGRIRVLVAAKRGFIELPGTVAAIPDKTGAYVLFVSLARQARVHLGGLGPALMEPGGYLYVGSAKQGIRPRCRRYLEAGRNRGRWHIDRLLRHPSARLRALVALPESVECEVVRDLLRLGLARPVSGFGASDCRKACKAHLLSLGRPAR